MVKIPEEHLAEFKAETAKKSANALFIVNIIGFILYPMSALMDWLSYPEHFFALSVDRFTTTAVLGLLVLLQVILRRTGKDVAVVRVVAWVFIAVVCASLDGFTVIVGGGDTPYYAGVNLFLLAVLVAMPWGIVEMAVAVVFVIVQVNIVNLVLDEHIDWVGYASANYFYIATTFIGLFWTAAGHSLRVREFLGRKAIEREKARSEELLLNILPVEVAEELKSSGRVEAKHVESCSILFTDFVGFTEGADRVSPADLVRSLDAAFSTFDGIVGRWGVEKLKTIGDAFMAAGGVIASQPDHLVRCIGAGLEMFSALNGKAVLAADGAPWRMRIGINQGPVVAGVIGQKKFAFDLWGDTVNTASRLTQIGQPGSVALTTEVYRKVEPFFVGEDRGEIPIRGKGTLSIATVLRLRPRYSADETGLVANGLFHEHVRLWAQGLPIPGARIDEAMTPRRTTTGFAAGDPLAALPGLADEDRDLLLGVADQATFHAGQVLLEQGQSRGTLLLISSGRVSVQVVHKGKTVEVGVLGPGEVVGEMSFVSWVPASAMVFAIEEVKALRFQVEWIDSVVSKQPYMGQRLFRSLAVILAQRIRDTNSRLADRAA